MKIGIIIPTRGDRPQLLDRCMLMMQRQTLQPFMIMVIDEAPASEECDITYRYRKGYESMSKLSVDLIAFIEDDDYYAPEYLETMGKKWEEVGKPDLLGVNYTYYYHLRLQKYFKWHHESRSSMMSTLIRPGLQLTWCRDTDPYTDIHLWSTIANRKIIVPERTLCIGMKHGIGKTGGIAHINKLERFVNDGAEWLKEHMDEESYSFYNQFKA
jgi:glycosyltransferase involved in cell wall biosynthesis